VKHSFVLVAFVVLLCLGCSNDDSADNGVRIRVENRGEVFIKKVTIDNNTFLNIPPGVFSEYQVFQHVDNFPPSNLSIESEEQRRGLVIDYVSGARIEDGFYTYVSGFTDDGGIIFTLEED